MTTYSASAWQIQAAWLIAKGEALHHNIALSQAFRMLREQGHEPLMKCIKGPVLQAAYERGGVAELAPLLFASNSSIKGLYDTGAYGEITRAKAMQSFDRDGIVNISGKVWNETLARIAALEKKCGL